MGSRTDAWAMPVCVRLATAGHRLAPWVVVVLLSCAPVSIDEAERKGNVTWLDQNGTPDAIAAIGRLADRSDAARTVIETRSAYDADAFRAAWGAVVRGADWGTTLLRAGLADPKRSDLAASAVDKHDARLAAFTADLEQALERLSATTQNFHVASALGAVGAKAHDAVLRRLGDPASRTTPTAGS